MKREMIIATLVTMMVATVAYAQQPERKLVETWRDGDYIVERYIVTDNKPHKAEYVIHFAINSSTPSDATADNDSEFKSLDALFNDMKSNKLMHLKNITVTGYASPDGTTSKNEVLAKQRAEQIASMIMRRYNLANSNITVSSNVEKWSATAPAIEHSSLSNRSSLVRVVNSNEPPMTIDNRLKHEKAAWNYLTEDVLPDMRRAVVSVTYTEDKTVDSREYNPVPREVIVVEEECVEKDKHDKCPKHDKHDKHNKHGKRKHKVVDEWEGVIIDYGASTAGDRR